ncbi:hypothetical protein BGX23_002841 [Mortierella sp. AD031]|nr:hypothetical protein BGX23_002841 [Mortierella sp. AD031]
MADQEAFAERDDHTGCYSGARQELNRSRGLAQFTGRKLIRADFSTRIDITRILRQLAEVPGDGAEIEAPAQPPVIQVEDDPPQDDKEEDEEEKEDGPEAEEADNPATESSGSGTGQRTVARPHIDPVDVLRRYVNECDNSQFAPWIGQVNALVANLMAAKRLPDLPPEGSHRAKRILRRLAYETGGEEGGQPLGESKEPEDHEEHEGEDKDEDEDEVMDG